MEWRISKNPFGMLEVEMDKGETITAEPGALVYMQGDVDVKTSAKIREQGFLSRLKTAMLGRESFFLNDYIARGRCMLGFAGSMIGDIEAVEVKDSYIVQGGSYMASIGGISLDTKFQGFVKGIFGTELFMLKVDGSGTIFVNSYGSLFRKDLKNGERMVIDNYNLVAMNASAEYRVTKIGGIKTFILGGEGLGVEVNGPATVYLQSRNMMELKGELTRLLELDKYVQKGSQPQPQSQPQFDIGLGRERRDWDTPRI
ncbi:MAG: TIGR00266 family protein [Candidatus Nitrosocaldus sp.]|nr:TIGR00266 family protein [Candidatus Nitrosocaldus sp.]